MLDFQVVPVCLSGVLVMSAPLGRLHVAPIRTFGPLRCLDRFEVLGVGSLGWFNRRFQIGHPANILIHHDVDRVLYQLRLSLLHKLDSLHVKFVLHFQRLQLLIVSLLVIFLLLQLKFVGDYFTLHFHDLVMDIKHLLLVQIHGLLEYFGDVLTLHIIPFEVHLLFDHFEVLDVLMKNSRYLLFLLLTFQPEQLLIFFDISFLYW